jgi:hypothetical protein
VAGGNDRLDANTAAAPSHDTNRLTYHAAMTTFDIDALSATVAASASLQSAPEVAETIAVIDFETTGMSPSLCSVVSVFG